MGVPAKKKQQQGERSRESILDATERLMATKGYAATSISDIRDACGLAPSSIYWHFGSKEGVLAAMMERGAQRFFAAIPTWDEAHGPVEQRSERQLTELVSLQSQHPDFLRLFYLLSMERSQDPAVAAVVRRVRNTAIARFRDSITHLLPSDTAPGFSDESVRVYLATGLREVGRPEAHHEEADMTMGWYPIAEAARRVLRGEIVNSIAIAGVLAVHAVTTGFAQPRPLDTEWIDRPTAFAARRAER